MFPAPPPPHSPQCPFPPLLQDRRCTRLAATPLGWSACRSTLWNPCPRKATLALWPVTPAGYSPAVTSWPKMATLLEPKSSVSQEGYSPTEEWGEGREEREREGGREREREALARINASARAREHSLSLTLLTGTNHGRGPNCSSRATLLTPDWALLPLYTHPECTRTKAKTE